MEVFCKLGLHRWRKKPATHRPGTMSFAARNALAWKSGTLVNLPVACGDQLVRFSLIQPLFLGSRACRHVRAMPAPQRRSPGL